MTPTVAVGAVVLVDGHLLLVSRTRPPAEGQWTVPGGKVEAGERLTDAVIREVLEETGLTVSCGPLIGWVDRIGEGYHYVILDFRAEPISGHRSTLPDLVAGDDAGAARWVPLEHLATVDTVPGLIEFLIDHDVLPPGLDKR